MRTGSVSSPQFTALGFTFMETSRAGDVAPIRRMRASRQIGVGATMAEPRRGRGLGSQNPIVTIHSFERSSSSISSTVIPWMSPEIRFAIRLAKSATAIMVSDRCMKLRSGRKGSDARVRSAWRAELFGCLDVESTSTFVRADPRQGAFLARLLLHKLRCAC